MTQDLTTTAQQSVPRANGSYAEARRPLFRPATDIYETDDRVVLTTDIPGVAPEELEVTLERRVLTIRGRAHSPAPEGYRQVYAEYGPGDYERVFTLSDDIAQDDIKAHHRDGVLTLELPKAASAKPRRIDVHAA